MQKLNRAAKSVCEIIELVAITVAIVILLTVFVCRHSVVVGHSMDQTLADGEHLIISDLFYTPKTYDIVVFDDLSVNDLSPGQTSPLIKRVIATEGQYVSIRYDGVYVDGEKLDDSFTYMHNELFRYSASEYDGIVPEGKIFVMGDHRDGSWDSRDFGYVDERAVIGKVLFRIIPFKIFN